MSEENKDKIENVEQNQSESTENIKQEKTPEELRQEKIDKIKDIIEWIICIIIALALALVFRYYVGTPTLVQQSSMYPTLKSNERLILNRTFRITGKEPKRGDIITFESPTCIFSATDKNQENPVAKYEMTFSNGFEEFLYYCIEFTKRSYIKRVVGIAGDHIEIKDGKVFLNGEELEEPYLQDDVVTTSDTFNDFIVPEGYVFAIGDNRENSVDCRKMGCIPLEKVEGIVTIRFWPLNKFGKIDKN